MSTTLDVTITSPTHWKYISEGGASIVFSYVGPSNEAFNNTALRLRKAPLEALLEPLAEEQQLEDPDDPSIAFQHQVIERLLPEEFLPQLKSVHVNRAWLEGLARLADEHRPPERKARDAVDTRKKKATLATDLVGGKGLAVEIKVRYPLLHLTYSSSHLRCIAEMGLFAVCDASFFRDCAREDDDLSVLYALTSQGCAG